MRMRNHRLCIVVVAITAFQLSVFAQTMPAVLRGYQHAPKPIPELLDARPTPLVIVSPGADHLLVADRLANPPIADLAQPMLRLAGLRINPITNGRHHPPRLTGLHLITVSDGKSQDIRLPQNANVGSLRWSPDGRHFAFTNTTPTGIELWVGETATASAHVVPGLKINAVMAPSLRVSAGGRPEIPPGLPLEWMPDNRTLLVVTVPAGRGNPPAEARVPDGPIIQESDGKKAPAPTFEDLLQNPHDEEVFDFYATAQVSLVDSGSGRARAVGKPGVLAKVDASPDGAHILVEQVVHPYTYLLPVEGFPKQVEVWDQTGEVEYKLAGLPSEEHVPIEGVLTGPRGYEWLPSQAATLVWAEALDGGDTKAKVPYHDHLLMLSAPFKDQPKELAKLEQRYMAGGTDPGTGLNMGPAWAENGAGLIRDYDRSRRWVRTFLVDASQPGTPLKLIWEHSIRERYRNPGIPLMRTLANGKRVLAQSGNSIFLAGPGSSPKGDFPFLDRFDLKSLKAERIFQCADGSYESPFALVSSDGSRFITEHESPSEPPNYFMRTAGSNEKRALTNFPDPAPQLRGITKQIVTYKRADGVPLSFTLYLPPDYKKGERLPTIVWAYPLEFNDADTAGQVSGSPYRFTTVTGISHLFLLTQGYAILDSATMPVVGDPDTMNNTYVEQVVASAKAAVDKAVEMGVTDPNRVGVGGHSYGAFMTANLLAHSDLFRAGVARSGAYNRTLTPFGFQSERRTLWEAPDMYLKVSPFMFADKIRHPILLIHGMADDNSGTFPIQSERMYQAIKGNGGIVRYVQLPYEAHAYLARESTEHTLYEMVTWFDKWVKNASSGPASGNTVTGNVQ